MIEDSKLFNNIWRFNALIIAVAGVLAILVLAFAVYRIYKDINRNRHRNEIVNIDPEASIKQKIWLGRLQRVKGVKSVLLPLYSDQEFSLKFSGSKSTASTRNILFSNIHSEKSHWSFPNNQFLIAEYKLINEENSYGRDKDIIAIIYNVIKADTNNDSRLTDNDKITIALSDTEGNNYTEVLTNIDILLEYEIVNKEVIIIVFDREGSAYTSYVNLSDFSVAKEISLPKFN